MRTLLLFILFSIAFSTTYGIESVKLLHRNGVNYFQHSISKGETIFQLAKDYSLRPNVLSQFNGLPYSSNLSLQSSIDIPLTETNFFKFASLNESGGFIKVLYEMEQQADMTSLCKQFGISSEAFKRWNKNIDDAVFEEHDQVIVGWLKYNKSTNSNQTKAVAIVAKENPIITTKPNESLVNPQHIAKSNATPSYSQKRTLAEDTKDAFIKVKNVFTPKPKNKITNPKPKATPPIAQTPQKRTLAEDTKDAIIKVKNVFTPKPKNKISNPEVDPKTFENSETKPSKPTAKVSPVQKSKPESQSINQKIKSTWNSIVKNPEPKTKAIEKPTSFPKNETSVKYEKTNATNTSETQNGTKEKLLTKEKTILEKVPDVNIDDQQVEITDQIDSKLNETKTAETSKPIINNEAVNISFKNSRNGKAAYFFSGPTGIKFYVATSLASKGSIVKVTNLENGKSIFAEVIGSLPAVDESKGLMLKISDNAKLALKQKTSPLNIKISY